MYEPDYLSIFSQVFYPGLFESIKRKIDILQQRLEQSASLNFRLLTKCDYVVHDVDGASHNISLTGIPIHSLSITICRDRTLRPAKIAPKQKHLAGKYQRLGICRYCLRSIRVL